MGTAKPPDCVSGFLNRASLPPSKCTRNLAAAETGLPGLRCYRARNAGLTKTAKNKRPIKCGTWASMTMEISGHAAGGYCGMENLEAAKTSETGYASIEKSMSVFYVIHLRRSVFV